MSTNDDDQKIAVLRDATQDRDADSDPRWAALADGTLADDERERLHAEAMLTKEGRALWDIYRPFDAEEKARLFENVRDRVRATKVRRKAVKWSGYALPPLMAATFLLYFGLLRPQPMSQVSLTLGGTLGDGSTEITLRDPDDPVPPLAIMPSRPIRGVLSVRGALLMKDGEHHEVDLHPNPTTKDNVIYIAGTRRDLFPCVGAGRWDLVVFVSTAGGALSEREMLDLASGKRSSDDYGMKHLPINLSGPAAGQDGASCHGATP